MDNDEIYEVTYEDYKAFLRTLKPSICRYDLIEENHHRITDIYSNNTNNLLCRRSVPEDEEEEIKYYIFSLPTAEESLPPKPVRRIVLETKEEVEAFFDILNRAFNAGAKSKTNME